MGFNFHVPLPGPFSYSARLGGKRRRRSSGPTAAESFAAAAERGGQRLLDHQAQAAERHEAERIELLARARRVAARTGDVYRAEVIRVVEHLNSADGGTVQYASRSKRLTRLLDAIEAEPGATSVTPSTTSTTLPPLVRPEQPAPPQTIREMNDASAAQRRAALAARVEALRGRVDTTALDAGLAAMDAERGGSWPWTRRAEELRRALGKAEKAARRR